MGHIKGQQDAWLHNEDGMHRGCPTTNGRDLERHERQMRRHLALHQELRDAADRWPEAGDAVRLLGSWDGLEPGELGVIDGFVGARRRSEARVTFRAATYRGPGNGGYETVSSSVGRASYANLGELQPTGERTTLTVWRWKDGIPCGQGEDYTVEVDVWGWLPPGVQPADPDPPNVQEDYEDLVRSLPEYVNLDGVTRVADAVRGAFGQFVAQQWAQVLNDLRVIAGDDDPNRDAGLPVSGEIERIGLEIEQAVSVAELMVGLEGSGVDATAASKNQSTLVSDDHWEAHCRDFAEGGAGDLSMVVAYVDWERFAAGMRTDYRPVDVADGEFAGRWWIRS